MKKFFDLMKTATIEREVEDVYNQGISLYFDNSTITHPFECDGLIDTKADGKMLKLIMEYKYDREFASRVARANVIVQVLYYVKRFETAGLILPNVALVGDRNECFVFHINDIIAYLDEKVDWSIAPSSAAEKNPDLVLKMANDDNLNPFVFVIDEHFDFKVVADKIRDLAANVQRYVHVTEHNIATIFEYFKARVVKDAKISVNDLVSVFLGVIKNDPEVYAHPVKRNTLVAFGKTVQIDGNGFRAFAGYFNRTYTPQEKMRFDEIADRLVEDTNRRKKGEFYTPTLFVDYAHRMIEKELGEDWREKYVVWDNCCGTCNLTRDYRFGELYCSTLEQSELEIGSRYNPEAVKFQFDFLNDYIPMPGELLNTQSKVPAGLVKAFEENRPMVFFINPPYGTACNYGESSKSFINDTATRKDMINDKLGAGAENLQHQFMYRIAKIVEAYKLTNVTVALFSNPIYLTGTKQADWLNWWCSHFQFQDGILFCASHFADVSDTWGITFNVWKNGQTADIHNFPHHIVDMEDGEIKVIDDKNLYNIHGIKTARDWSIEPVKKLKTFDAPNLSSGLTIKDNDNVRGKNFKGNFGYFYCNSNNIAKNSTNVGMFSSAFSGANGFGINADNFTRCTALFTARKCIQNTWANHNDEYMVPNTAHEKWEEFEADSLVYSLFNAKSNQSSLRHITYKGNTYDIRNQFFWMTKAEMMQLAADCNNDAVYDDARTDTDRHMAGVLAAMGGRLSPEAKAVLDKATEMVRKSVKYRELYNDEHPECHINTWDAGYYQLKGLWQQYLADDFKELRALYKALEQRLIPMVYELGFLRK